MLSNKKDDRLTNLATAIEERDAINRNLYDKYNIMHGLRYKNGTGVLVGITRIGAVKGYRMDNGKKIPMHGKLLYRGYDITKLIDDIQANDRFGFEEVCYLLLFGELPTEETLNRFKQILVEARDLPEHYLEDDILKIPGKNIMNKMMRSTLALYVNDVDPDSTDTLNVLRQSISLIAKMPLIMAYCYQAKKHYVDGESLVIHFPKPELGTAENILHLIRPNKEFTDEEAKLLDLLMILHAEHGGGNNSAFANHVVTSSGTDTYSAIATALGALKGPRHGGANLKVVAMLDEIRSNVRSLDNKDDIRTCLNSILDGEAFDGNGLIYGMGHAVYTIDDPRAVYLKKEATRLAPKFGYEEELNFIKTVEEISAELIKEKKGLDEPICANIDMYSGLVFKMLGIPRDLFTPIFATSRMPGWCAHRLEQIQDKKIIRPAYVHLNPEKKYQPLKERTRGC